MGFIKGVDKTIEMLTNSGFAAPISSFSCGMFDCSGMVMSKTGTGADLQHLAYTHLGGGHFGRYEPVPASSNTWIDAASYCSFGRRRGSKNEPVFPTPLLDLV